METVSYKQRRGELETYFDRTAVDAWKRLTSDAPVGRIRATVRAGRDRMRSTLLSWLPEDLTGRRVLDAGCGTGALAVEAARRGAHVTAIDLSPTLIGLARERAQAQLGAGQIEFLVGDLLDTGSRQFDHVVAMDSLIHYRTGDMVHVLAALTARARVSVVFTFAPATPALRVMHAVGQLFPRGNRSPAIEPVGERRLLQRIAAHPALSEWRSARSARIASGFYTSQAHELLPAQLRREYRHRSVPS